MLTEFGLEVEFDLLEQFFIGWFFAEGGSDVEGVDRRAFLCADACDVDVESVLCEYFGNAMEQTQSIAGLDLDDGARLG